MNTNSQHMRAIYNKLLADTGITPQLSTLRLEQPADGSKGTYTFPIKQSTGTVYPLEIRLNENDAFWATHVRLRIKEEILAKTGMAVYQSYANASAIVPVAAEVVQADLDSMWNSFLNIIIDRKESVKALDMTSSRVVRTTQQSSASTRSELHEYDGFIELASGALRMGGSANVEVRLITPSFALKYVQHVTSVLLKVFISLEFYGFNVPGGSALGNASVNY